MSFSIAGAIKYGFSISRSKSSRIFMLWLQAMLLYAFIFAIYVSVVIAFDYFVYPGFKDNFVSGKILFRSLSWNTLALKFLTFDFFPLGYTALEEAQTVSWSAAILGVIAFIGILFLAFYVYSYVYASLTRIALDWHEKKENNRSIFQIAFNKNYLLLVLASGLCSFLPSLLLVFFKSASNIAISYLLVLLVLIFMLIIRLFLTWIALIDKEKSLIETLRNVWTITENNFWKLLVLIFCLTIAKRKLILFLNLISLFVIMPLTIDNGNLCLLDSLAHKFIRFFLQFIIINSYVYTYKKMSK